MRTSLLIFKIATFLLLPLCLLTGNRASASPLDQDEAQPSPSALIDAVNNLRVAQGLNALNTHPVLMQVAQGQADALAATNGAIGHSRPSGITLEEQLILLGYPLSGDLSLGGYRSENFAVGRPGSTVQETIQRWLGDAPHTNTMLAEYRSDIGAGVAVGNDGQIYYVIETALQTESGQHQSSAGPILTGIPMTQTALLGDATQAALSLSVSQYIIPVTLSTARPDGDVFHEVLNGQSLWSIAIAYGVKIDQIKRYNNLPDVTIYNGQTLLIQIDATQPAPEIAQIITATPMQSQSQLLSPSAKPPSSTTPTLTITPELESPAGDSQGTGFVLWLKLIGAIVLLVLVMHALISWLSYRQNRPE